MKIQVTQEDIDNARPRNCYHCPVARAVTRAFDMPVLNPFDDTTGPVDADTCIIAIHSANNIKFFSYPTPGVVIDFMRRFDNNEPVEPFEFHLP